jgi:hypothetical protein
VDDIVTRLQRALDPDSSVRVDLWESICAAALDEIERLRIAGDALVTAIRSHDLAEQHLKAWEEARRG